MQKANIVLKFLRHFFTARHTKGYGVHSPYLFNFVRFVIRERNKYYLYDDIEKLRSQLLTDSRQIEVTDFGTGYNRSRKVSDIAAHSLLPAKHAQLLFRMVKHFKPVTILELGTSLGLSTAYMASNSSNCRCISLEGCPQTASIARENFSKLQLKNITIVEGDIDKTLLPVLAELNKLDFVFIDANHTSRALIMYFEACVRYVDRNTVMVFDDIHWSDDMEIAWNAIKKHEKVKSTIDLFRLGIVFFNTDLNKKDYKIRY